MPRHRSFLVAGILAGAIVLPAGGAQPAAARAPDSWSDFDGDGYTDLAIGVPRATVQGMANAGAVIVLYGGPSGFSGTGSQHWNANNSLDTSDDAREGARFGFSLAAGDFDKDGFGDLAIGAPNWGTVDLGGVGQTGKVYVLFGSASGLVSTGSKTWTSDADGESISNVGYSLVTLDWFDFVGPSSRGDGFADLAVGAPTDHVAGGSGRVTIIAGQLFAELPNGETTSFHGEGMNSRFGHALAAGDFNDTIPGPGAGRDDVAIGVPYGASFAGMVVVKQRGSNGQVQTKTFDQDTGTIADSNDGNDFFGSVLAAGDVVGDGLDDLIVGVPDEDVFLGFGGTAVDAGVVHVIPSNPRGGGLSSTSTRYRQGVGGVPGTPNDNDRFGESLAIGDFGRSHLLDLAIGSPGERAGDVFGAGGVFVMYGEGDDGLDPGTTEKWNQASTGILDSAEAGDWFGARLTAGDYNGDYDDGGRHDLAIGVPREGVVPAGGGPAVSGAGLVNVIVSLVTGLDAVGNQIWHLDSPGVPRSIAADDWFGDALR